MKDPITDTVFAYFDEEDLPLLDALDERQRTRLNAQLQCIEDLFTELHIYHTDIPMRTALWAAIPSIWDNSRDLTDDYVLDPDDL